MNLKRNMIEPVLQSHPVRIPMGKIVIDGELTIPVGSKGLIVFAQGNGRSAHEHSRAVATVFNKHGLATLLTALPASTHIAYWVQQNPETVGLHLGFFAAGPDVTAALITAAQQPELIKAVVSRGGRPDLIMEFLPLVKAPVLLIAAGRDPECLGFNQHALRKLNDTSTLNVIPRASKLFEEPGAMEEAEQLAALWFSQHLG